MPGKAAKITKTPDEVACIRHAQLVNELAMIDAQKIQRPGVRRIDVSAAFLRRAFELGATARRDRSDLAGDGADPTTRAVYSARGSGLPLDARAIPESEMTDHRTVFNHVGLCVSDRARSRRFYEGLLGFQFWWELTPPDPGTDRLLQLDPPLGLHATYLVRDGLVLELLDYSAREVRAGPQRVMDEVGLTHISLSVSGLASVLRVVPDYGGSVVSDSVSAGSAMIRDPDGQLLELLDDGWLAALPPRP